ncbi:hypothetical protein DL93DRAFT_2098865 [Clavulina sp. PMI_390]|nr:hypothetical protein DL93DRAFT_2098865 [Clavulina sp. PMI_390]
MLAATPAVVFALLSSSALAVPVATTLGARGFSVQPLVTESDSPIGGGTLFGDFNAGSEFGNAFTARSNQVNDHVLRRDTHSARSPQFDEPPEERPPTLSSPFGPTSPVLFGGGDLGFSGSSGSANPNGRRDASGLVGVIGDLIGLFLRRDDGGSDVSISKRDVSAIANIVTQAQSLSANDKATVKNALVNKLSALQARGKVVVPTPVKSEPEPEEEVPTKTGPSSTANTPVSSTIASGAFTSILKDIESIFKREDLVSELDDRSLVGTAIDVGSGLLSDLLDAFLKRSEGFEVNELD